MICASGTQQLGMKRSTVYNILKRHAARLHDVSDLPMSGRPKNAFIYVLLWPNKSPDLKFIENISAHITRQINRMNLMPINAADLRRALHTEWRRLTQTRIRRPIAGIHRRLRAIVAAQGGHTRC